MLLSNRPFLLLATPEQGTGASLLVVTVMGTASKTHDHLEENGRATRGLPKPARTSAPSQCSKKGTVTYTTPPDPSNEYLTLGPDNCCTWAPRSQVLFKGSGSTSLTWLMPPFGPRHHQTNTFWTLSLVWFFLASRVAFESFV